MVTDRIADYITERYYRYAITSPRVFLYNTMFGLIFVVATVIQAISSQGPPFHPDLPEQCRRPPQDAEKPHECCKIPPFFSDTDFKDCGFQKLEEGGPPRPGPPDCSKQMCMLKKYGLVKDDGTVDPEKMSAFVDEWAESNPDFKPAVDEVKSRCIGVPLPGPPHICEANKLLFCAGASLFGKCTDLEAWNNSDGCTKLKDHMTECAPYFQPPKA